MALANRPSFIVTRQRRTTFYAIALRVTPASDKLKVEVQRTTDSAGAPNVGAAVTIGEFGPFPIQGGTFTDLRANNGATWWYRCRHTGEGNDPGNYTSWVSSTPRRLSDATSDAIGDSTNVYPVRRTSPLTDGDYAWRASDTTGNTGTSTNNESGGKRVNRLFAKPLSSDPDTIDSAPDGSSYAKILGNRLASGAIKRAGAYDDGDYAVSSSATSGLTAKSTVIESGGKAINRLFAKALSSDSDNLDFAADGSTYKRVAGVNGSNLFTSSSTAGRFRCRAKNSATQSIPNNTGTTVTLGAEDYDVGSMHDNVTNNSRLTIPTGGATGVWLIHGWVNIDTVATNRVFLYIYKNGSLVTMAIQAAPVTSASINIMVVDDAPAAGDYYELIVLQDTGAARTLQNATLSAVHLW